jgi:hypothetical protein
MSIEVQIRRGTNAENAEFTGQEGEIVYTTDTKDLFVHDGSTVGGIAVGAGAYTHPNHTGEVTSTGDGATVIANGVVDSDNLSTTLDFGSIA